MNKCSEMAIGYIIRSDGYRCDLCEMHQAKDWQLIGADKDGCTLGRYPIVDRDPKYTCQRIVPDIEVVLLTDEYTSGYPKRDVKFAGANE